MHENDISMHKNGYFPLECAPEIFMGNWAEHHFMHRVLIHVKFCANVHFHAWIVSISCL